MGAPAVWARSPAAPRLAPARPDILHGVAESETARLLGGALARDPVALGDLLERLRPRVVLWAATRLSADLKARVDPEDVAQLVLLAVHQDFDRFAGRDQRQLLAWVFSIAENRVRDLARRFGAAKRTPADEQGIALELADARAEARSFSRTSPSEAAARNEAVERMRKAMDTLHETQRTILRLRDLETHGYEEIVAAMGLASVGAARTLRCRALIALRDAMDAGGEW